MLDIFMQLEMEILKHLELLIIYMMVILKVTGMVIHGYRGVWELRLDIYHMMLQQHLLKI
jgi:hypothetical protein